MRVGWLIDDHGYIGGAEMTAAEFRAAAPKNVAVVPCPPEKIDTECDAYVAHNAVQYSAEALSVLEGKPVVKYAHDLVLHDFAGSRDWLRQHAEWVFCSPAQRERMGMEGECIPPALNFKPAPEQERSGTCSIAQWRNPGKGPLLLDDWATANGAVDVYGPGGFLPNGPGINYCGETTNAAETLARYERFVFLPIEFEPFCRTVVEAHLAGCEVITNDLIGARYYIEENPEALQTAASDFWRVVLS